MTRISKVLRMEKKNDGEYAVVYVQMEDGLECGVTVGGECETFFHKGVARAFVKRSSQLLADNRIGGDDAGIEARVCKGTDEAIAFIEEIKQR